jgi:glutamine synthetase
MNINLSKIASQKKIKYFLISFVDLFGVLRAKLVPTQAINEMQKKMVQALVALQPTLICHPLTQICSLCQIQVV